MKLSKIAIKVFDDIDNPEIRDSWIKLQYENNVFPQLHYQWIKPWWEHNKKDKNLHIVAVFDDQGLVSGLAPFCIKKEFGIRVICSIPEHFGDFYELLGTNEEVLYNILEYLKSFESWSAIKLFNCNSLSSTYNLSVNEGFTAKKIVDILSPKFKELTFDEFLKTISKNSRNQYKKKLRRLAKEGEVKLVAASTWEEYMEHFEFTKDIYNMRWQEDDRPLLSDSYYQMRNEALKPLFESKNAVLFLLKLNGETIAFRLGFLNNKTFYDWKVSHSPKFNYYSPGFLTVGLIIEHLIDQGFSAFNFMTGNYQYKRSWTNTEQNSTNYELLYAKKFSIGQLYVNYRKTYRDKIKEIVKKIKLNK